MRVICVPDGEYTELLFTMVHIPSAYAYNFWSEKPEPAVVEITFLMPNGVIIPVEINRNSTVTEIKEVNISYCMQYFIYPFN